MSNINKTKNLTVCAIFAAIIAIISFLPIRVAVLEITLAMVPVAVGAICFGEYAGLFLGTVFGIVSFLQCLGYSPFGAALLQINPFYTFLVCVPTRAAAGYLGGLAFRLLRKNHKGLGFAVSSLLCPLLNTVFFTSVLCLLFYNTEYIQGFATSMNATNPFIFIILFVGINGLVELIAGFVLALPCSRAVAKFLKI